MQKTALFYAAIIASFSCQALQPLTDDGLSSQTGQSGLTVQVYPNSSAGVGTIGLQSLSYKDTDGMSAISELGSSAALTSTNYGASAFTAINFNSNGGIHMQTASGSATANPVTVKADVDGGTNGISPVLLISAQLPSDMRILQLDVNSLALSASSASSGSKWLTFSNGIRVIFDASPLINIALGNRTTAGYNSTINLSTATVNTLDLGRLSLASNGGSANEGVLSAAFKISGLNLSGSGVSFESTGAIFRQAAISGFNAEATGIIVGQQGLSSNQFSGFTNASLGSFGISNLALTNATFKVSGL